MPKFDHRRRAKCQDIYSLLDLTSDLRQPAAALRAVSQKGHITDTSWQVNLLENVANSAGDVCFKRELSD